MVMGKHGLVAALGCALLFGLTSCGGGSAKQTGNAAAKGGVRASLLTVQYGRVVDIYAWRRVDPGVSDRLTPGARKPVLIERDVVVSPQVLDEDPFATSAARYRFMPYDPKTGHRELLILFDDQNPSEKDSFNRALDSAKLGLVSVSPYNAFNPGNTLPAPIVPRDAAIVLTFDRPLGLDTEFFLSTPSAVQLLTLDGDPSVLSPAQAYSAIPARVVSKENGKYLIIDPEVTGNEATGRSPNPDGLPASLDKKSANIRIALPTSGVVTKKLRISPDNTKSLNSIGVSGEQAVIRDFRSGNEQDANLGYLPSQERAELVAVKTMGILQVDAKNSRLLLNKRFANLVLRGRVPFVDGPLSSADGRPLGRRSVPQGRPFQFGDLVWQDVLSPIGERVRIKAEILINEDIPSKENDKTLGQGGGKPTVWVKVSNMEAVDSQGNVVRFQESTLPLGAACTVVTHYHDLVKVGGGTVDVGDSGRRAEFIEFDPAPPRIDPITRQLLPPNENLVSDAAVIVRFSKPMILDTVRTSDNVVVANRLGGSIKFIQHTKVGSLSVWPTIKADPDKDATAVRISSTLGFFHRKGSTETYNIHIIGGSKGPRDRGGNELELFLPEGEIGISSTFKLAKTADDNLVGMITRRFNSSDEDGTKESELIPDSYGQFQQRDGKIYGFPTTRVSKVADGQTLPGVVRGDKGECTDVKAPHGRIPRTPVANYSTPTMLVNIPPIAGGISEPFVPQGSRLQMTYLEDDFQLGNANPLDFEVDVEQLNWAPFIGRQPSLLTFDVFDRVSMVLSTSEVRPDFIAGPAGNPARCSIVGGGNTGLSTIFEDNYLDNAPRVEVVKDRVYKIDPSNAFLSSTQTTFIPYPKFDKSYTWRDRRIVSYDPANNKVLGLGGAQKPKDPQNPDITNNVTSPWIPENDELTTTPPVYKDRLTGVNNSQVDDFLGSIKEDHHPIALPLLVDFFVYPDDPQNGTAKGANLFQIAYHGPIWPTPIPPHGFYNGPWPRRRAHSTGGIDLQNIETLVDPKNEKVAQGGWLQNAVLGRFKAPPTDDHVHWAQADFVRKISVATFGYVDLLQPGKNAVDGPSGWPKDPIGFPNLLAIGQDLRPAQFSVLMEPRPENLPEGTDVILEFRGSEGFDKDDVIYAPDPKETAKSRGNLLNPNYACEQYRYSRGRVAARGMTPYVKKIEKLFNNRTGGAPRFLNWRITFVNNVNVTPARVPFVDFLGIVYRVRKTK
ncbi:MAG TPA: hypothetical protein ENK02_00575 [Planctomycetes bacterium]|nr:hypothetical protein [Planctomycetota bacterium]